MLEIRSVPGLTNPPTRKERSMRRGMWLSLALAAAVGAVTVAIPPAPAQTKKLVYWTHWDQQPDFNKWYTEKGKEFAKKTGYEVEVVTIPYQGYEAKYLAALMGKSGAPDFFNGMTHQWCGQYDFCEPMPQDLAKIWDESIPKYMVPIGKWKNARYGTPLEHGNFQQMYMNVDLFKKAGLDADKPPKTLDEWLAAMRKLTSGDTQVGFALRHKGHPVGITDKFLPFAHAYGARMLSPDLEKATGYANSAEMVAALQFFGDLVLKDKVASLALGNPEDAFGQKRAAVIFRESWFFGWVHKNAPEVKFKVAALPCGKTCPGAGALFPWTNLVYKNSPNKQVAWEFIRFISNPKDDLGQHQFGGFMPVFNANLDSAYAKGRPDYQSTKDMLAQPVPPTYFHPKSNELATAFGEAVVGVLYGKGQPKPLLDEAAAKMDRILQD
jgi:multiple sugar transport system substrate-binding protein